ncbi:hypothetical protein MicB006_5621 [Micromonospora sp. B006]|nr:hypothetical protein MicB006_5621 [Micromonospora sp. B006]
MGFGRPWTRRSGGGRYWVFSSTVGHSALTASIPATFLTARS